jgi:hypothetical protein
MPLDGAGQDAVQTPPVWMLGRSVLPSRDRHIAEAMISPEPHSDAHQDDRKAGKSVTSESFTSMGGIRCCDHGNSGAPAFDINNSWIGP